MQQVELQAFLGAATVYAIEHLKRSKWFKWLHADSKQLNRAINILISVAIASGVTYSYDAASGTLSLYHVTFASVGNSLMQWLYQQVLYDGVVQKSGTQPQPAVDAAKGAV